jgi:integrase/recombinase XerC
MTAILERFGRFLERSERSPHTIRNYRGDLEGLAVWFPGHTGEPFAPSTLTPTDLRAYKRWLIAQNLKPNTINRKLATLKSFLHWAVDVRLLRRHHGLHVPLPSEKPGVVPAGWIAVSSIGCSGPSSASAPREITPP